MGLALEKKISRYGETVKIVFFGAVQFSAVILRHLLQRGADIAGVCAGPAIFGNADFFDLEPLARSARVPVRRVNDANHPETLAWVQAHRPDVIFCFGWSRLIRRPVLEMAPLGVIGFHPSLLPLNRGRHPLIWALALGLSETGSTFFFMDEGADSGDILSQVKIPISKEETAATLYKKIQAAATQQVDEWLPALALGTHVRRPQPATGGNIWRKRAEMDGEIDWRMADVGIYNLVRALSSPYDGAKFRVDKKTFIAWRVETVDWVAENIEPGKVVSAGPGGPVIKAGKGAIRLLETQPKVVLHEGQYL